MSNNIDNYISLAEYAVLHGIKGCTARQRVNRGSLKTAIKIGGNWIKNKNEPFIDGRIKSGKYIGFRKKYKNTG